MNVRYSIVIAVGLSLMVFTGNALSNCRNCKPQCAVALSVIGELECGGDSLYIPDEWKKSRVLRGLHGDGCGGPADGTVEVKCGKANKKGMAKVSMKITRFDGRKTSFPSISVDVAHEEDICVEWQRQKYYVKISGDEFSGEPIYGNARPACMPDAVWSEAIGGKIPDGSNYVLTSVSAPDIWSRDHLLTRLMDIFTSGRYCVNDELSMPLLVDQPFTVRKDKFDFGKKPLLKYRKIDGIPVLTGINEAKPNIPGTKITYNAKTGVFKGSFTLYTDPHCCYMDNGRLLQLKKYSFKIVGVVINGRSVFGAGIATCRKPAFSCPIYLRSRIEGIFED